MNEKMKVYVKFGEFHEDPVLIIEDKKKDMTIDSGELEFLFEKFFNQQK